jgi:oligopeptide/dipeptide ABC transporter ATP-binding protein
MDNDLILEVKKLRTYFTTEGKIKKVIDDLSFSIKKGKVMGLVGGSGTGKSVIGMSILNLISKPGQIVGGEVLFKGRDLLKIHERELQRIRGSDLALVSQDPYTSMDPLYTVGNQLVEVIRAHEVVSRKEAKEKAIRLLTLVGIPDPERRMLNFPHQFSGGMQQRVVIAMAIACNPSLIIMDDPTRSLDVTIQAQILSVLSQLRMRFNTTMLLISASVQVVAQFADDVMTIFGGRCMEIGPKQSVFRKPCHPYTRDLLQAVPSIEGKRVNKLKGLDALHEENHAQGCVFYTYCSKAQRKCLEVLPVLVQVGENHFCACHF